MLTKLNQQICKHCFSRYMDFGADKWFWDLELFCHCRVCDIPVIKYGNQFGYWYSIVHYRTILLTVELKQSLQWRHNERDGVSNHQPHDWLLNLYSGADQRKPQSSVSLSFVREIPRATGEFPAQRASNAEKVSTWWRHHDEEVLTGTSSHLRAIEICAERMS